MKIDIQKTSKSAVWKNYEKNEISHSVTHYLFAIEGLLKKQGYVRAVDIAKKLDITPGSCSIGIKGLLKKGLVVEDDHRMIRLSEKGELIVEKFSKTREVFERFFIEILGASQEIAVSNACKVEHLIDDEITSMLENYLESIK